MFLPLQLSLDSDQSLLSKLSIFLSFYFSTNSSRSARNQYILSKPLKLRFSLFYQDNRNEIGRAGKVYYMREDPRIPRRDCPPLQSFIAAKSLVLC